MILGEKKDLSSISNNPIIHLTIDKQNIKKKKEIAKQNLANKVEIDLKPLNWNSIVFIIIINGFPFFSNVSIQIIFTTTTTRKKCISIENVYVDK